MRPAFYELRDAKRSERQGSIPGLEQELNKLQVCGSVCCRCVCVCVCVCGRI